MALLGSFYITNTKGSYLDRFRVDVYDNGQSIANNTSTIYVEVYGDKQGSTSTGYTSTTYGSVTIDGTQVCSWTKASKTNTNKICSGTLIVNHDDNGAKSISVSGSAYWYTNGYTGTKTGSATYVMPTIPRASSIAIASTNNGVITKTNLSSGNVTVTITRKVDTYTHNVTMTINGATITKSGVTTSATFTFAEIESKMSNVVTTSATISCQTMSGSTAIGSATTGKADLTIDTSTIKPTITLANIALNNSTFESKFIAGYAVAKCTATLSETAGSATTSKVDWTINGATIATTSNTQLVTNVLPQSADNYTVTIGATITDSRGVKVNATSKSVTVLGYSTPTITINTGATGRCNSSGTIDATGTYFKITFTTACSSIGANANVVTTSPTYTSGTITALAVDSTYSLTITATDSVGGSTTKTTAISTANFPLDLYDDGVGNVGVGFGTSAVANLVRSDKNITITSNTPRTAETFATTTQKGLYVMADGGTNPSKTSNVVGRLTWGDSTSHRYSIWGLGNPNDSDKYTAVYLQQSAAASALRPLYDGEVNLGVSNARYKTAYLNALQVGSSADINTRYAYVISKSGQIYMHSAGSDTGSKGISVKNADGTTKNILAVDQSNNATFKGRAEQDADGNALSLSTQETSGVVTRSSGGTLTTQLFTKYGKMAVLSLTITCSTEVSSGSNLFVGTVASGYRPPQTVGGGGYYSGGNVQAGLTADGTLTVRVCGGTSITASNGIGVFLCYMLA